MNNKTTNKISKYSKNRVWTKEKARAAIKQCLTLSEFQKRFPGARKACYRYGWIKLYSRLKRSSRSPDYWTQERISAAASKCSSRVEFCRKYTVAYNKAWRNGWLEDVCKPMPRLQQPNGYWSFERVQKAASKYSTRTEFMEKKSGAYQKASKEGWLEKVCFHMMPMGSRYKRAIYAFEFKDRSVYVGLTFNYEVRYREHLTSGKIVQQKKDAGISYRFRKFGKWLSLEEVRDEEERIIFDYRRRGWLILNIQRPGGLGSYPRRWSRDVCEKLARRFTTLREFRLAHRTVPYVVSAKHGWLADITSHMTRDRKWRYWTFEKVKKVALRCRTRDDLSTRAGGAFAAAKRNGWLDEVCKHMIPVSRPANYWGKTTIADEAKKFPTRTKFRLGAGGAYHRARRSGWLDEVCGHMSPAVIR